MDDYIATTYLDTKNWTAGLNWMRQAKSTGFSGFILGYDLSINMVAKAKELGFRVIPVAIKFGDERDLYYTLSETIKKGQRCLLTHCDVIPKKSGGLFDIICNK